MKQIKFFSIITLTLFLFSCPSDDDYQKTDFLTIKNSSDTNVFIFKRAFNSTLYSYPPSENNDNLILSNNEIVQGEEFNEILSDDGVLYIWLFDEEVINNNSWEDIVDNDMYLIRYELTFQDLEDMNWEIEYDGL